MSNHAHTVGEFSAEAFVLLLYRGRNCAASSAWSPTVQTCCPSRSFEAACRKRSFRSGLPPRVQKILRILNILFEGTFRSSAVARASTWNMSRNRRWPSHDEGDARPAVRAKARSVV